VENYVKVGNDNMAAFFFVVAMPGQTVLFIFELIRQARPGRQTAIRLFRPVQAEGQNKSWGHQLTDKANTYQERLRITICLT
jgi:hypothetical protein